MDSKMILELVGYVGSALVVISMLMSSIVKLRVINIVGSIISGTYAVICHAIPLALMNICLIIINVINLFKLLKTKKDYALVVGDTQSPLIKFFMQHYEKDIRIYFPAFNPDKKYGSKAVIVCHDGAPAGIMLGEDHNGTFDIDVEYATPAFRDCSVGKYLYSHLNELNINTLRFTGELSKGHIPYLEKMGYVKENGIYTAKLN